MRLDNSKGAKRMVAIHLDHACSWSSSAVFFAVLFLMVLVHFRPAFADDLQVNDRAWDSEKLNLILNSNLALNGFQAIEFPKNYKKKMGQVLPCWSEFFVPLNPTPTPQGINYQAVSKRTFLEVKAIQYLFNSTDPAQYRVEIGGDFKPNANLTFGAMVCGRKCSYQEFAGLKQNGVVYQGQMPRPKDGEFISKFVIGVGQGVTAVHSLTVSGAQFLTRDQQIVRDQKSIGICFENKATMIGPFHWTGAVLFFLLLSAAGFILWWLIKSSYFHLAFLALLFLLTNVLGLALLYFGQSEVRLEQGISDRTILVRLAILQFCVLLVVGISFIAMTKVLKNWAPSRLRISIPIMWAVCLVIALGIGAILTSPASGLIDFYLTSVSIYEGSSFRAAFLRNSFSNQLFLFRPHYNKLVFQDLTIFLSLYAITGMLYKKKYRTSLVIFLFQMSVLFLTGEKAPLVWYLASALCVLVFFLRPPSRFLFESSVVLSLLIVGIFYFGPSALRLGLDRMLFGSLTVAYTAVDLFPEQTPFLFGKSISAFGVSFFGGSFDLDLYLWRNIFLSSYFSHLTGTATGPFWVQGYANFGMLGALIFAGGFGMILATLTKVCELFLPAPFQFAALGWLVWRYVTFTETNFSRFVFDFYSIGLVVLVGLIVFVSGLMNKAKTVE